MGLFILVSGPPGVGKSTLAKEIAKQIKVCLLDKDRIDEPFSPNDRGEVYTKTIEPKVLTALLALAELNLEVGNDVLIDLPWTHILLNSPEWIEKIQQLTQRHKTNLKVIELTLSEQQLRKRIEGRALSRDQSKLSDHGWERFKLTDRVDERIPLKHLLVDATCELEKSLPKVLQYLSVDSKK